MKPTRKGQKMANSIFIKADELAKELDISQGLAVDEEVPPDLLETLQMVALTLNGLKEECE
jgi:hypothetical protein